MIDVVNQLVLAAAEPVMSFDLLNMWRSMGPFAKFIAIVLAVMSVWSLAVAVERILTYSRSGAASRKYADELAVLLPAHKFKEAIELAPRRRRATCPACSAWPSGVPARPRGPRHPRRQGRSATSTSSTPCNRAIDRCSLRTVNELRRGLGSLATIGSTAPFVGLLGTVWGIIKAFQKMAIEGGGGLGTVSGAIAEALINTAFGLLVAIPAVMFFNYLTNRVEDMQVDITDSSTELVDFFLKEGR